jgi:hypothetical protein
MKLLHHQLFRKAADKWVRSATLLIRTPPGVKNNVAKPRVLHAALRGNLDPITAHAIGNIRRAAS